MSDPVELSDLYDYLRRLTERGPGSGWPYRIQVLEGLYAHEKAKLGIEEGNRYRILTSQPVEKWFQPGLEINRAVTVRSIDWSPPAGKWFALVAPEREWWWNSLDKVWVERVDDRSLFSISPAALTGIPDDWEDPGDPTTEGPQKGVQR